MWIFSVCVCSEDFFLSNDTVVIFFFFFIHAHFNYLPVFLVGNVCSLLTLLHFISFEYFCYLMMLQCESNAFKACNIYLSCVACNGEGRTRRVDNGVLVVFYEDGRYLMVISLNRDFAVQ